MIRKQTKSGKNKPIKEEKITDLTYFMKNKEELFSKFKEFKALIENHTENKIKTFRSDNGGEFTLNEFKKLCKHLGIKREVSTPYNPQHNGIAERKNRTIMEVARAMLHDQYIPM